MRKEEEKKRGNERNGWINKEKELEKIRGKRKCRGMERERERE